MAKYTWKFTTYRANGSRVPYRIIMNSRAVQAMLLSKAKKIAAAANAAEDGIQAVADVRPGKNRAHARVSAHDNGKTIRAWREHTATFEDESLDDETREDARKRAGKEYAYLLRSSYYHKRPVDRVLRAALDAARG